MDKLLGSGLLPDNIIRWGIRDLLRKRLDSLFSDEFSKQQNDQTALVQELKTAPIAVETDKANDQHYMLPPEFFTHCLGERLKYSCGHWDQSQNLDQAEEEMLKLTLERSGIRDGDKVLELGHGWGAITLYMAEKCPNSEIVAVSNSSAQGEFIRTRAKSKGYNNVRIITADMSNFDIDESFDRVISIEMFEHMRNYKTLLNKISSWLKPEGTLFVHIFVHRLMSYKFEAKDSSDWMSKYFFSGGIMPSDHLLYYFNEDMVVEDHWRVCGTHYQKTARAWLENMDLHKQSIMELFDRHYPKGESTRWLNYWRIFFMSCEELWGYRGGSEWFVAHYLLKQR